MYLSGFGIRVMLASTNPSLVWACCGILVPPPGSESRPSVVRVWSPKLWIARDIYIHIKYICSQRRCQLLEMRKGEYNRKSDLSAVLHGRCK